MGTIPRPSSRGLPWDASGHLTGSFRDPVGATGAPILGAPSITPPNLAPVKGKVAQLYRFLGVTPPAGRYRYQAPGPVGAGLGVEAMTPQLGAIGVPTGRQGAVYNGLGTQGANVPNPLFGRPGFSYVYSRPAQRFGPVLKGAPGTGNTAGYAVNRAAGFVPAAHAVEQFMPMAQFDYTPDTDPYVGIANEHNSSSIPRSIGRGDDGIVLLGTYRAHDFTPADRFFKQGKSAGYWQDQSFGPNYRDLLGYQQVARYNLYNDIALARPLSPNAYFLGYQTQPTQAAQLGGVSGMGRPLGY